MLLQGRPLFLSKALAFLVLTLISITMLPAHANEARTADRQQLLAILADAEQGINQRELERFIQHFDDRATVTWLNAEVSTGPQGVRDYFQKMVGDHDAAILSDYKTFPELSESARIYGNVAIANGTMRDEFTPHDRGQFNFDSVWAATLSKQSGQWKIISLNLSTNSFNNALTEELKSYLPLSALAGFLFAVFIVVAILVWRRRTL